jgi:hypothetical protein
MGEMGNPTTAISRSTVDALELGPTLRTPMRSMLQSCSAISPDGETNIDSVWRRHNRGEKRSNVGVRDYNAERRTFDTLAKCPNARQKGFNVSARSHNPELTKRSQAAIQWKWVVCSSLHCLNASVRDHCLRDHVLDQGLFRPRELVGPGGGNLSEKVIDQKSSWDCTFMDHTTVAFMSNDQISYFMNGTKIQLCCSLKFIEFPGDAHPFWVSKPVGNCGKIS